MTTTMPRMRLRFVEFKRFAVLRSSAGAMHRKYTIYWCAPIQVPATYRVYSMYFHQVNRCRFANVIVFLLYFPIPFNCSIGESVCSFCACQLYIYVIWNGGASHAHAAHQVWRTEYTVAQTNWLHRLQYTLNGGIERDSIEQKPLWCNVGSFGLVGGCFPSHTQAMRPKYLAIWLRAYQTAIHIALKQQNNHVHIRICAWINEP